MRPDPMRGTLGNTKWASIVMIPVTRARQPRDGEMKCGTQSADMSVDPSSLQLSHASRFSSACSVAPW